jgi:DNA-directed RNA polymerase specialized sigma24 family protein
MGTRRDEEAFARLMREKSYIIPDEPDRRSLGKPVVLPGGMVVLPKEDPPEPVRKYAATEAEKATRREHGQRRRILELREQGLSYQAIADRLGVTYWTVKREFHTGT